MTLPLVRSTQKDVNTSGLFLSPSKPSSSQLSPYSATRIQASQSKVARSLFASGERRLYEGTGRSNQEATALVQLGEKLHSREELGTALVHFTAAIADKDKCKANDLSHAQAYLGAAAIYECDGKKEKALDHYHKGSHILVGSKEKNPPLLAGSYIRIAFLYVERGYLYFSQAIDYFKKALDIYKSNGSYKSYEVKVNDELRKIYRQQKKEKIAAHYENVAGDNIADLKLFQKGQVFLQDYLELHVRMQEAKPVRESSRSSVDTEPSPLKQSLFPSIEKGSSPKKIIYRDQGVGSSPLELQDQGSSPLPLLQRHQNSGTSPVISKKVETLMTQILRSDQSIGRSPLQVQNQASSPLRFLLRDQNNGSSPLNTQSMACSPVKMRSAKLDLIIERLKKYEPGFLERGKGKVAKALLERAEKFSNGEMAGDIVLAYIDAYFDITDNPAFAGNPSRLATIFEDTRKELLKRV